MTTSSRKAPSPEDFRAYFNVADELHGGLPLDDLDRRLVAQARKAADGLGLTWPPRLAEAEEYTERTGSTEIEEQRVSATSAFSAERLARAMASLSGLLRDVITQSAYPWACLRNLSNPEWVQGAEGW